MTTTLHQSTLDKILIVDFEDSFTFNIASVLFPFEKRVNVVSHCEFFTNKLKSYLESNGRHAVILGPGPGHPDDYQRYFFDIKNLIHSSHIFTLGICLGHQLMGRAVGYNVLKASEQIHGRGVLVNFNGRNEKVQRYNSLSVYVDGEERDILYYPQGISYQFHPESVGTQQNDIFFKSLLSFIHS